MKIINIYSSKNINIITLFISIVIFIILNLLINNFTVQSFTEENQQISSEDISFENIIDENIIENESTGTENESNEEIMENLNWYIEIPSIYLKAPIKESTNMEILNEYIGHFEDTSKTKGNIGLAGHNRGYKNNYFENLNKVQKGEEIKYKFNDFEKIYIVQSIEIIKSTNWSFLENTTENKLTLITCVENRPDERLCVQAIEKQDAEQAEKQDNVEAKAQDTALQENQANN
ncbi:MAG: class D sortase [Clostridia bacterium]|nr:class D sortase [Clostridia bacterium]